MNEEGVYQEVFNVSDLCKLLIRKENKEKTIIAHNGKGYDFQFIYKYLLEIGKKPSVITNGNKIMMMKFQKITFIDSLNLIPIPLKAFASTFNIENGQKGDFPYLFNKPFDVKKPNTIYSGSIPDIKYFDLDHRKTDEVEAIIKFHNEYCEKQKCDPNLKWNLKDELAKYCHQDVNILRLGCVKLRQLFKEIANIDPFAFPTIASCCSVLYRCDYMPENKLPITKPVLNGVHFNKALLWLAFIEHKYYEQNKEHLNLQTIINGGEAKIGKFRVDGYHADKKTIYEFHGCFWHGCPSCYHRDTLNPVVKKKMSTLALQTQERIKYFEKENYTVIQIWEHDFDRDKEIKKFSKANPHLDYVFANPLDPQEAFFGG